MIRLLRQRRHDLRTNLAYRLLWGLGWVEAPQPGAVFLVAPREVTLLHPGDRSVALKAVLEAAENTPQEPV